MKNIAITQRLVKNENYHEIRDTLDINYARLFDACGFLPIILPSEYDFEKYFETFKIDGIFLTGGNDLYDLSHNALSKKRDEFEKKLISFAIKKDIPIFGVCRGLQIIANYFGAKFKIVENQIDIKHKLLVNKESKYYNLLSKLEYVNSYHNFALECLNEDLTISANSYEGIIKAIEHKSYKIFACMWHSEREISFNEGELNLIKEFFR